MQATAKLKRFPLPFLGAVFVVALVGACNQAPSSSTKPEEASTSPAGASLRVALVLPGSAGDRGFNESAAEAVRVLEERHGADVALAEMTAPVDFDRTFADFASAGFDVVIGHGFEFGDVAARVAPSYPGTYFFVTNNPTVSGPNYKGLQPASHESAYLAGVAAGSLTRSARVGAVGGFSFPVITTQFRAFEAGVRSVRPDAEVRSIFLETFEDVEKGKEAALALASSGVDVVHHIADSAGLGVIAGARQAGISAIGWGKDQSEVAPETVVASQIVDQKEMIVRAVEAFRTGTLPEGVWRFGLDTGVTGLTPVRSADEAAARRAQERVDSAREAILRGEIEVPYFTESS